MKHMIREVVTGAKDGSGVVMILSAGFSNV